VAEQQIRRLRGALTQGLTCEANAMPGVLLDTL